MYTNLSFSSRKDKEIFLREIIQKLTISASEKEIYSLCIEVLNDSWFENFFQKIYTQVQSSKIPEYTTIEPLTATLI